MVSVLETKVLKGVSRSFYLSLRLLPVPMRKAAGIAYLLARTSDTIADSTSSSPEARIERLQQFLQEVRGERTAEFFSEAFFEGVTNPREVSLLQRYLEILSALRELSQGEIQLIHEVLETIVSGQILDIERFGNPASEIRALKSAEELDDYTWRVAGCVGLFWTRLGFLRLGDEFSKHSQNELEQWAVEYGKGLQLVNLLRDFPQDLKMRRCYLPVGDPEDESACLSEFKKWREIAIGKVACGTAYTDKLLGMRLRLASGMPAIIAKETLYLLDISELTKLEPRLKISRSRLYGLIFRECLRF